MPQPPAYTRTKDFTENFGSETDHSALNAELDAASNSINDIRYNLAIIQADDGKLRAGAVTSDSISPALRTDLINGAAAGAATAADTANTKAAEASASASSAGTSANLASDWAQRSGAYVTGALVSAKEWAVGAFLRGSAGGGSAKDWATFTGGTVDNAEFGAKEYAQGAAATGGSAKSWAQTTGAYVAGTLSSAKEWAVGTFLRGMAGGGSAKDWATYTGGKVDDTEYSAKKYAADASSSASAAASSAASIDPTTLGAARVSGLIGVPNATTPQTKFDLSANAVVLRNAAGSTKSRYNTGTLTCDLGLAGSAANGRDQAAAFTANSWIYLYFVWNGTTLATLASTTAPASFAGATLPTGYTHWSFATAIRWNASSNIVSCTAQGSLVMNDLPTSLIAGGQATSFTALAASASVPPNALTAKLRTGMVVTHTSSGQFDMYLRRTGLASAGILFHSAITPAAGVATAAYSSVETPLGTSQQIDYRISSIPVSGGGAYVDVLGYRIPNGGE